MTTTHSPPLDPSQLAAVSLMTSEPLGIVTGGPGTGKTTTLRVALDALDARGEAYALAAPTGKAARRMAEATGRDARTIHRLLEYGMVHPPGRMGFARDAANPVDAAAVFVDEASMLDVELAASLFAAIDVSKTRVILIGDADQLPSVGPGRVFADLIRGGRVAVARLTTLHRAARESWVCRSAAQILVGQRPSLERCDDFEFVEAADADDVARKVVAAMRADPDAQVLAPQNTGRAGVAALNAALQGALNPPSGQGSWKFGDVEFRVGDRVICTSNDYERGVMNGECGRVAEIGPVDGRRTMRVAVDGRDGLVDYAGDSIGRLRLGYAITIHRSQGSEWSRVVVVCHSTHSFMLTRQILYTAITRAKQHVTIVGDVAGIAQAIKTTKDAERNTGLAERIEAAIAAAKATSAEDEAAA